MTLKTNFIAIIITGYLSVMILSSCGSHSKKTDDAFDSVKKEKMLTEDSILIRDALKQEPTNAVVVKKNEIQDEWTKYKIETERKIYTNENIIREIRALPKVNANMLRKVASLEKENNDLRIKMDEYNEEVKERWENFKTGMNHDVNEIGIKLKAIKITHKK